MSVQANSPWFELAVTLQYATSGSLLDVARLGAFAGSPLMVAVIDDTHTEAIRNLLDVPHYSATQRRLVDASEGETFLATLDADLRTSTHWALTGPTGR